MTHVCPSSTVRLSFAVTVTVCGWFHVLPLKEKSFATPLPAPTLHAPFGVARTTVGVRAGLGRGLPGCGGVFRTMVYVSVAPPSTRSVEPPHWVIVTPATSLSPTFTEY